MGSGTVAATARRLGRDWLGIELNPEFAQLANDRLAQLGDHPPPLKVVA
jgi:DNA modification methylase